MRRIRFCRRSDAYLSLDSPQRPDQSHGGHLEVGGADIDVLALNRSALGRLRCEAKLEVVPGASHLFEEPGTLESV